MIKGEKDPVITVDRFCKVCNTVTEQEKEGKLYICLSCFFNPDSEFDGRKK